MSVQIILNQVLILLNEQDAEWNSIFNSKSTFFQMKIKLLVIDKDKLQHQE
jgi:hypothetical protein